MASLTASDDSSNHCFPSLHPSSRSETSGTYDPDLDSSRDGLPLMLKQCLPFQFSYASVVKNEHERMASSKRNLSTQSSPPKKQFKKDYFSHIHSASTSSPLVESDSGSSSPTGPTRLCLSQEEEDEEEDEPVAAPGTSLDFSSFQLQSGALSFEHVVPSEAAATKCADEIDVEAVEADTEAVENSSDEATSLAMRQASAAAIALSERLRARGNHADWSPTQWTRWISRQKQIELGRQTPEYHRVITACRAARTRPPQEPLNDLKSSKRAWEGRIRAWRKQLHHPSASAPAISKASSIDSVVSVSAPETEVKSSQSGMCQALAEASTEGQKQLLGEALYPLIAQSQPELAGKITGMLLELENEAILHLLESCGALDEHVAEAVSVLREARENEESSS